MHLAGGEGGEGEDEGKGEEGEMHDETCLGSWG